ncbi:MAG TPA: hypothetical protein VG205_11260 [Acidimicrobiales bacterium]|nr:hypothetical protein [Acidimicrobiales bacterium]
MRLPSFARSRTAAVTAAVAVGSLALAGCAGQEQAGTPAHQITEWVTGAGAGSSIGTVEIDIKNVNLAFSQHDPAGEIRSVCGLLVTDAGTANGNLPSPDQQLSDDLSNAYATAYDAGTDCYNGSGGNQKLLATSATLRAKAEAQMATALERITAVTGRVFSTTTTTAPANVDPFGN